MHAPDGFLDLPTAVATGVLSAGAVGLALRQAKHELAEKQIPLAGLAAAFVFAAQMINFPVAAGTTGHLLGGALAAILLGPAAGTVVVAVVVVVQALVFADGGLTALGYNVLNMAVVTAFGGHALFRLFRRLLPRSTPGVVAASGLAAGLSVVLAAAAFSLEWLFGATVPVPFDTVFGAMVGVHLLIGLGEGVITALTVGAVLAARPDLVAGARDLDRSRLAESRPVRARTFLLAGTAVVALLAAVVSQLSATAPDGLERVAAETGIAASAGDHALAGGVFADYATAGIGNPTVSLAVAGVSGAALTLAIGFGIFSSRRRPAGKA